MAVQNSLTRDQQVKEIIKCGRDAYYFINTYVKIQHPLKGLIQFKTFKYQDDCLNAFEEHRFNIVLKSRQLGLSTVSAAYALWLAIFHREKNILCIATKLPTAGNFIKKVKVAWQALPQWLKLPKETSISKSEIAFDNGSQIKAIPTSEDAGRSEALSLLIVDECVTGDSLITIKDTETQEELIVSIEQFYSIINESQNTNNKCLYCTKYQVKTQNGFKNFDGIKKSIRKDIFTLTFDDNTQLSTTPEHRILSSNNEFCYVKDVKIGFKTSTNKTIIDIKFSNKDEIEVYDLLNVEDGHQYFTNDVISHNCAWVRDFSQIWTGLYPTLSAGGSAILISTPNGTTGIGAPYYYIWTEAESGQNDFNPIRLPWQVHPDHDQKWFDKEVRQLGGAGSKKVKQELLCDFLASGDTYLQPEDLDWVNSSIRDPISKEGPNRHVWIWKHPVPGQRYIISADVARGDGADFSTFHILDYETNDFCAEFMGKCPPDRFGELLFEWGKIYNNALIAPELNNYGFMTATKLRNMSYTPLYYSKNRGDPFCYTPAFEEIPGFNTQTKSRVQILSKLEEVIRNKQVNIQSRRLYEQLNTFVWNNGKAQASADSHDDLVISIAIGCCLTVGDSKSNATEQDLLNAICRATSVHHNDEKANVLTSVDRCKPLVNPSIASVNRNNVYRPREQSQFSRARPGIAGMLDSFNMQLIK